MKKLFLLLLLISCVTPGPVIPSPSPTPSPTPVISPTPIPTPNVTPFPPAGSSTGSIDTVCKTPKESAPSFTALLSKAMNLAKASHPEILSDKDGNLGDTYILKAKNWNVWYWAVIDQLKDLGVDSILDDCGGVGACGEIQLALHGTKKGSGFADGYQALYSSGQIPLESFRFRGRCEPKWWDAW